MGFILTLLESHLETYGKYVYRVISPVFKGFLRVLRGFELFFGVFEVWKWVEVGFLRVCFIVSEVFKWLVGMARCPSVRFP